MATVLMQIPLKVGSLASYERFVAESTIREAEWREMLARYDIHSARIWHSQIAGCDYIFVYHEVGPAFQERMADWDTSTHPFDVWFRGEIMAVYDIENAAGMEQLRQLADIE